MYVPIYYTHTELTVKFCQFSVKRCHQSTRQSCIHRLFLDNILILFQERRTARSWEEPWALREGNKSLWCLTLRTHPFHWDGMKRSIQILEGIWEKTANYQAAWASQSWIHTATQGRANSSHRPGMQLPASMCNALLYLFVLENWTAICLVGLCIYFFGFLY